MFERFGPIKYVLILLASSCPTKYYQFFIFRSDLPFEMMERMMTQQKQQ